jgi:hypothetical protein
MLCKTYTPSPEALINTQTHPFSSETFANGARDALA